METRGWSRVRQTHGLHAWHGRVVVRHHQQVTARSNAGPRRKRTASASFTPPSAVRSASANPPTSSAPAPGLLSSIQSSPRALTSLITGGVRGGPEVAALLAAPEEDCATPPDDDDEEPPEPSVHPATITSTTSRFSMGSLPTNGPERNVSRPPPRRKSGRTRSA